MIDPYYFTTPKHKKVPILVSVPHSGTQFPQDIVHTYNSDLINSPDDTDWYVDKLYSFAPEMGISMIAAKYSRWVIDLNRDPESQPLYNDGRLITGLCPTTTFANEQIYKTSVPDSQEVNRRLDKYYRPYYQKIQETLDSFIASYGVALLWDAHSIRTVVPTIHAEAFPDMILGNADEKSASSTLINTALNGLKRSNYEVKHNYLFRGGHITRYFGKPDQKQHALQLEMTKINYMDDAENAYAPQRAGKIQDMLKQVFSSLIENLTA